jgi:hypothetical protein
MANPPSKNYPKFGEPDWEYVFSQIPYSYYVDVSNKHIAMPTEDILVFFFGVLDSPANTFTVSQWTIRATEKNGLEGRIDYYVKADTKTRKIFDINSNQTAWMKIKYNSPIYRCSKYIYNRTVSQKTKKE